MTTYNTGNPVPSADARDRYDNSQVFDEYVTGPSDTTPDRLGVQRRTWRGMQNAFDQFLLESGYVFIGDYDADGPLTITERNQIFTKDGEYWRAGPALALPYTTVNNWVVDQPKFVSTGDASLRQALAQPSGAGMVGFRMRTVADRLNDTANVKDYGAIADGTLHPLSERFATLAAAQAVYPHATSLTDSIDWAALVAAFNSGTPHVHAPGGHYVFNKGHTVNGRNVYLTGDFGSTRFDFSQSTTGLLLAGSITQIQEIGANIGVGAKQITFASAPSLVAGDVFCVYNPTDGSWLANRAPYRAGEFFRAHSVNAAVVNIYGNSTSNYLIADVDVYRVNGISVKVENVQFVPPNVGSIPPLKVQMGVGVRIMDCFASTGGNYTGVEVERCYDVTFGSVTSLNNSAYVNDEYGITISNSQKVNVIGGGNSATRHAVAIGGGDFPCGVTCRQILVYGTTLENYGPDIGAADTHGNCDQVTYDNCILRNGANMAGRDITYRNCTIYGVSTASGECIYGSEIVGGTYTIENCRLVSFGDGGQIGYINLTPSNTMKNYMKVIVRNVTIEAPGGALSKMIAFRGRNMSFSASILIDGLHCEVASGLGFLFADDDTLTVFPTNYLIVDNVYGPAGMALIYPTPDVATVPRREMQQTGYQDVTTTSGQGSAVAGAALSFRYPYSKMPDVRTGVSLPNGGAMTTIGGQAPVVVANTLSSTSIRMALVAGSSTFNANIATRLHWQASIREV